MGRQSCRCAYCEWGGTMVKSKECVEVGVPVMSDFTIIGVNGKVGAAEVGAIWK